MSFFVNIVLISLFVLGCNADDDPIVSLQDGLVRGAYKESYNGRKYIAFEGIPYAKAPIQNLRFEDPQPVEPWFGILEATTTYTCTQLDWTNNVIGQEDCLYINVYVPREKINPTEKLDVIVHIHGGAFMLGSGQMFAGPGKIMDRNVVYVHFNYRLGPFGFYSSGDGRGNYGLKDQVAALKWIQKNIEKFGGNKDSVTISGLSAGGGSVHLHYFSNLSKGLFHKGFAQSGTALNPWVIKTDPSINANILMAKLGCSKQSAKDALQCLKQRSALQIVEVVKTLYVLPILPLVPFGPIIEQNSPSSFLTKLPYSQLIDNEVTDVPLLMSMTTEEGTTPAAMLHSMVDDVNENFKKWFPLLFDYYDYDQGKKDEISKKIKEFYFQNQPLTKENYNILIKACTHREFHLGGEKAARLQANTTNSGVYFFLMKYYGEFMKVNITGFDVDFGSGHGFDAKFYYTGDFIAAGRLNKEEEKMKDILLDMMVAFAKTGKPTSNVVDFQPVAKTANLNYLLIKGPDDLHMETANSLGPHEFWGSLGLKENENAMQSS